MKTYYEITYPIIISEDYREKYAPWKKSCKSFQSKLSVLAKTN